MSALQRAAHDVQEELDRHGFWTEKLWRVDIWIMPLAYAEGLFYGFRDGYIHIPAVSLVRLLQIFGYTATGLRDVLRHEYWHAIQHCHPGLFRRADVTAAFGRSVFSSWKAEYDPELHVSGYACKSGWEHLAETGMYFLKYRGKCPKRWQGMQIEDQFQVLGMLGKRLQGSPAGI